MKEVIGADATQAVDLLCGAAWRRQTFSPCHAAALPRGTTASQTQTRTSPARIKLGVRLEKGEEEGKRHQNQGQKGEKWGRACRGRQLPSSCTSLGCTGKGRGSDACRRAGARKRPAPFLIRLGNAPERDPTGERRWLRSPLPASRSGSCCSRSRGPALPRGCLSPSRVCSREGGLVRGQRSAPLPPGHSQARPGGSGAVTPPRGRSGRAGAHVSPQARGEHRRFPPLGQEPRGQPRGAGALEGPGAAGIPGGTEPGGFFLPSSAAGLCRVPRAGAPQGRDRGSAPAAGCCSPGLAPPHEPAHHRHRPLVAPGKGPAERTRILAARLPRRPSALGSRPCQAGPGRACPPGARDAEVSPASPPRALWGRPQCPGRPQETFLGGRSVIIILLKQYQ